MKHSKTQRIVYLGILTGLAIALHVLEMLIPALDLVTPGFKLGLANIVSLYVILNFGLKEAVVVSALRTTLGSVLTGTFGMPTFFFSFFGGLVSTLFMGVTYRFFSRHFSTLGISLIGALTHNLTQLLVAALTVKNLGVLTLLPYLLFFALPTGAFVGLVTEQLHKYYPFSRP